MTGSADQVPSRHLPNSGSAVRWRVLIVDDQPLARSGLRVMLEAMNGVAVVAEAQTVDEALTACRDMAPNLVLMDMGIKGMDGVAATRRIKEISPSTSVVLTVRGEDDARADAFRAGASGSVPKTADVAQLSEMLRSIASDGIYLRPPDTEKLLHAIGSRPVAARFALTARERQVLGLLAEGISARVIGGRLGIGERTVNTYVANLYRKMGVNNRVAAVREGLRLRLIEPPV